MIALLISVDNNVASMELKIFNKHQKQVKNMQLINEQGEILLQFGKVDKKGLFHVDYKAPFTAFSALGAALAQFDL